MSQELRQQERFEHERAAAQLDRLNDRLSLTSNSRRAPRPAPGRAPSERGEIQLPRISDALPQVRQLQWVDSAPQRSPSPETTLPEQLRQRRPGLYHYCRPARRRIPLPDPARTRQPPQWLLAVAPGQRQPRPVESRPAHRQPALAPGRPIRRAGALHTREHGAARRHADPRRGTAAQQRLGFTTHAAVRLRLPGIGGELAIFLPLVGVTVYMLRREQQGLRAMTLASQRSAPGGHGTGGDRRAGAGDPRRRPQLLNPRPNASSASVQARQHHLLDLLPDLEPGWLTDAGGDGETRSELLPLRVRGRGRSPSAAIRWPAIRRSPTRPGPSASRYSRAGRSGCATSRGTARPRRPGETRRRYQDIFEGVGVALACSTSPPCARLWWSKAWTAAPHCAPGSPANPAQQALLERSASPRSTMSVAACADRFHRTGLAALARPRPANRTACACR
ncbi:hypothetical protein BANRA_00025 [Pseudomonas aeruginosa]|nr:hypothetical protein BANRA_00025 [Pseudomonas aeruginosa]